MRFVQIVPDLLVGISLLVLAKLREWMVELFRFKNGDCCPVTLCGAAIDYLLLRLRIRVKNIIRFEVLLRFRQTEVVGIRETEFLKNLVEQLLTRECFVVPGARQITFLVKRLAEFPEWLGFIVRGPPVVLVEARLEVVVGEQFFSLPKVSYFWHPQKFRMIMDTFWLRHRILLRGHLFGFNDVL